MKITWLPKTGRPPTGSCVIELRRTGDRYDVFGYLFGEMPPITVAEQLSDKDQAEEVGLAWAGTHNLDDVYIVRSQG